MWLLYMHVVCIQVVCLHVLGFSVGIRSSDQSDRVGKLLYSYVAYSYS